MGEDNHRKWTQEAAWKLDCARKMPSLKGYHLRGALCLVRDHSRRPATREEARRLLAVLEGHG